MRTEPHLHTLPNGLKVAFFPRPDFPFVSAQLWMRMGSCFEAADEAGMAHFIEHLAFRLGPQNEPPFAAQVDRAAGKMNAYTSHLNTVFFANVLKEDTPLALKSLLAILGPLEFNAEDVAKERQIILEEYAKVMASPYQRSYDQLLSTLDKAGGHKHPLIGTQESISQVTPEKLIAFRQKHYHASNALLLLSGGVENGRELLKHLEQQTLNEGQGKNPFANDFQITDPLLVSKSDCDTNFIHHVLLTGPYDEAASACAHLNQLHLSRHFKQPLLAGVQFLPGAQQSALIHSGILNETQCDDASIEKLTQMLHQVRSYQLSPQQFPRRTKKLCLNQTQTRREHYPRLRPRRKLCLLG